MQRQSARKEKFIRNNVAMMEDSNGHNNINSHEQSAFAAALEHPKQLLNHANQLVKEENFADALLYHDRALECYKQQHQVSVIACCSEATAWRNKGAIHRKLKDYRSAISAWKKSEMLFRNCRERVMAEAPAAIANKTIRPYPPDKQICLDACIVEVLQSRASAHMKSDDQFREAIDCHEEVIDLLLDIHRSGDEHHAPMQIPLEGVGFTRMEPARNTEALVTSLESLGGLYTSTGAYEDGLAAFEEALQILRARQNGTNHNQHVVLSMSKILYSLSELYFERNDLEHTIETLQETLDLRVSLEKQGVMSSTTREALDALDRAGQFAEESGRLDYAISCYEKALLTRNQFWGDQHIDVAKSLVNVGRVLELQGNTEGSLDLYRAAKSIYATQVTAQELVANTEDVDTVLQLVPSLLEQGQYEEAVSFLNKCLESEALDEKKSESQLDRNQIYFALGEAYMGMGDYVSATVCLVECAKQGGGSVPQDAIQMMLERVEKLKREDQGSEEGGDDISRAPSDELSARDDPTEGEPSMPGTPQRNDAIKKHNGFHRPSSTPLTEEISHNDSHNTENTSPLDERGQRGAGGAAASGTKNSPKLDQGKGKNLAKDLATARFDMETGDVEKPTHKRSPSDLSSSLLGSSQGGSETLSALDLSQFDGPDEDGVGKEEEGDVSASRGGATKETDSLLGPSRTSESQERRKARVLRLPSPRKKGGLMSPESVSSKSKTKRNFRPRRGRKFTSLLEEEKQKSHEVTPDLKREEEYHDDDESSFAGPIQNFQIPQGSWDDVSQITFVFNDGAPGWQRSNEWLWGVSAEGFGGWFPSQFVSQAVEAAEGFLSAKAVHSKVQSAPLDVVSDDDSNDSPIGEDKDHASNVGVATKEKQTVNFDGVMSLGANEETDEQIESGQNANDLQAMILASSTKRRAKEDNTETELSQLTTTLEGQRAQLPPNNSQLAATLFRLAVLQSKSGDLNGAIEYSTESLQIQQSNGDDAEVARNFHFLADLYLHQKQYKSSLSYYMEALEIEQHVYGEYSEESAKTLNAIGAVRSMQNEFKLAMESHKEALRVLKECHGEDLQGNPLVSQTLCQIGAVYYRERNALSTIKSKKDDYSTFVEAGMLEVIGRAHEERGSYKMAIAFFEEKLQFLENDNQDSSREDLATTLNSLGMLSSRAGLFMEALDYYERALGVQRTLGCDNIYLATAQVLEGTVQYQLGLWDQSLELLQIALATLRDELGPNHETVAATLYHIGVVKASVCDYDNAMAALNDALQIQINLLGDDHPAALRTRREIGNMFAVYPTEMETAFEHFTAVLSGQQKIHGMKHPNIAETLHAIGCAYSRKGDFSTALKILEECYYMRLEFLGVDHPLQATTLHEIARIHVKRESYKKAIRICDTVLDIRKESLSEGHIDFARALATKGSSLVGRGDFQTALNCATEALRVCTEIVNPGHPTIAELNVIIGSIYLRNCQFPEAIAAVETSIQIYRNSNIDDDYPGLQEAMTLMERIKRDEMLCV